MLLDNGRTRVLEDEVGRQALHCIRCSACLNVCPVYSRTGGHAYGSVYPGPIGAILTPQLIGIENAQTLPFASSLCGACYEVCPVKIDIPTVLLHLRRRAVETSPDRREAFAMRLAARIMASQRRFALARSAFAITTSPRLQPEGRDQTTARRLARVDPHPRPQGAGAADLSQLVARGQAMTAARDEILARIRATSHVASAPFSRTDRRAATLTPDARAARFCERVADYRAEVKRVMISALATEIDEALERRAAKRIAVPPGLPASWRPAGAELITDGNLTAQELDQLDGVITGCTAAIAETGTIVLSSGPTEGRRALTLVPDLHLCVVRESQIVRSVPEAIAALDELVKAERRPLTFISGPRQHPTSS